MGLEIYVPHRDFRPYYFNWDRNVEDYVDVPNYSTDIKAAWAVLHVSRIIEGVNWLGDDVPREICMAALRAKGVLK